MRDDIALVGTLFGKKKIAEPTGSLYLAAALRNHGFSVRVIEPIVTGMSVDEAARLAVAGGARIVGIANFSDQLLPGAVELARAVRRLHPNAFICVGGHGPTMCSIVSDLRMSTATRDLYTKLADLVDVVVAGEAETVLPLQTRMVLAGEDWRSILPAEPYGQGTVLRVDAGLNPDIESLPMMARDTLAEYVSQYGPTTKASLILGRGCPCQCSFCTIHVFADGCGIPRFRLRPANVRGHRRSCP